MEFSLLGTGTANTIGVAKADGNCLLECYADARLLLADRQCPGQWHFCYVFYQHTHRDIQSFLIIPPTPNGSSSTAEQRVESSKSIRQRPMPCQLRFSCFICLLDRFTSYSTTGMARKQFTVSLPSFLFPTPHELHSNASKGKMRPLVN